MTDEKITQLATSTTFAAGTDLIPFVHNAAVTPVTKAMTKDNVVENVSKGIERIASITLPEPNMWYASVGAQAPIFYTDAAITITRRKLQGPDSTPTSEIAGDLKFADDIVTGSYANATVIDVCDTTSGASDASTGFDDATVPANKWIYFQFDSAPHTDWKFVTIQVWFTYD